MTQFGHHSPIMSLSILPALQNVLPLLFDWLLGTGSNLAPRCTVGGSLSNGNKRATPGDYPCDFLSASLGCELGDYQVESRQSLDGA